MALTTPDFSVSQSDADPSVLTFIDNSVGDPTGLTERRIVTQLANGAYLTTAGQSIAETYEVWPIGQTTISIPLLPRGMAPSITVRWMTGSVITYSKNEKACANLADYIFALGLTLDQVADNTITQDSDWYNNKMKLIVNDADAENSIIYINDITLAQNSLDRNFFMIQNAGKFFGS